MAGTFDARIRILQDRVGDGDVQGVDHVNQYYAVYVETRDELRHTTGQSRFLHDGLMGDVGAHLTAFADRVLEEGGVDAMTAATISLGESARARTPVELNILRRSHRLGVLDNGALAWMQPPEAAPISRALRRAAARAQRRARRRRR